MSRSCPLVPGSLIPFYPLIQTMSHSNREEEEEGCWLRKASTGWRKEETRQELVGFAGVEGKRGGFRTTVPRPSPHYKKMELRFTIYALSATVCGRNMKRNMTCKTSSLWRQTKDKVQTLVRLRRVSLQTPGISMQPISCSRLYATFDDEYNYLLTIYWCDWIFNNIRSTAFLFYFSYQDPFLSISCHYLLKHWLCLTELVYVKLTHSTLCFFLFVFYPAALSRSRCRELAPWPCSPSCSFWVPRG